MIFNCSHTFTLEARDQEDFDQKLARYSGLVCRASGKLDIGYSHGLVFGRPGAGNYETTREDDAPLERLFES